MSARSAMVVAPRSLWDALRGPGDPHSRWIRDQRSSIALDQLATGSCLGAGADLVDRCVLIAARGSGRPCCAGPLGGGSADWHPSEPVANKDNGCGEPSAAERQRALMWAQRLKRVFAIDIEVCRCCGSRSNVKIQDSLKLEGSLD